MPLPRNELDTCLLTVQEPVGLAEEGQAADGDTALLAGLSRATEAVEDGEPWGRSWSGTGRRRWRTTRRGMGWGGRSRRWAPRYRRVCRRRAVWAARRARP